MTTRKVQQVSSSLCRKGFERKDTDHVKFYLLVDGKRTGIYTKISHGENEIGEPLIKNMAKQLRLSKNQFLALVDCTINESEYITILRENGELPSNDSTI